MLSTGSLVSNKVSNGIFIYFAIVLISFISIFPFPSKQFFRTSKFTLVSLAISLMFKLFCFIKILKLLEKICEISLTLNFVSSIKSLETLEIDEPVINDYKEANEIILRNIERLSKVIDDLMMLTNTVVPEKETFDLCGLLTEISNNILQKYKEKCVKIEFDFPKNGVQINEPKGFTERVFVNIIENAIKYNYDYGNIKINVSNNELLIVKISDTGIGISEENLTHILEPFYCADRSRLRKLCGAGLGLSIVKDISEQLGWKISVKSEKEKGTEFTVIIDILKKCTQTEI